MLNPTRNRLLIPLAGAAALAIAAPLASGAPHGGGHGGGHDESGGQPDTLVAKNFQFSPGVVAIKRGHTLTLKNRDSEDHSVSIHKKSQIPDRPQEYQQCYSPGGLCLEVFMAHEVDSPSDDPDKLVVNKGRRGLDRPGDSVWLEPNSTTKIKVSAQRGKRLNYFCAPHVDMNGVIRVED